MRDVLVMDRPSFLAWAEAQPKGRYERVGGKVLRMSPERVEHVSLKSQIWRALEDALTGRDEFRVLADGMTISIDDGTDYEPDVSVHCGPPIPPGTVTVPNPIIVVEVISPSSQRIDSTIKRENYLKVPSIQHYLIFRTDRLEVIHWRRGEPAPLEWKGGELRLDPPGITLDLNAIYTRARIP